MSENTERRYLKWYNKVGYGSGDVAGNVVYAFLSSFVYDLPDRHRRPESGIVAR